MTADSARTEIMAAVRAGIGRDAANEADARARVAARLAAHTPNTVPARSDLDPAGRVSLFIDMLQKVSGTVARVDGTGRVPAAILDYLAACNLPMAAARAPDPLLDAIDWQGLAPMLSLRAGPAQAADEVSVTSAFAGIAETGTLALASAATHPTTLNFLPETHIVVLPAARIVGTYEDVWARMRAELGLLPRALNLITGPSRTGDIEQQIELGAHGPRRLHVVIVDEA